MSRSLDKDILTQLSSEDPTAVYEDISNIFVHPSSHGLLEIELLGQSHSLAAGTNFLQDGDAIAIPKLRLVQAFFVARRILAKHLQSATRSPTDEIVAATTVILLMDPEYLTAANIRKKAVESQLSRGVPAISVLQAEKQFVDSLLTAHLHRHTKSPTLWSHRRWLMGKYKILEIPLQPQNDLTQVIMIAAERHPRNYYAWQHARWLIRNLVNDDKLLMAMADDVKEWCLKASDDISSWTFLQSVILSISDEQKRREKCSSILKYVLTIAESFYWVNESVWVFLRTMVATRLVNQDLIRTFYAVNEALYDRAEVNSTTRRVLVEAREWCTRQQQGTRF